MMSYLHTSFMKFRGVAMTRSFMSIFYVPRGITPTKMRGSKLPADMMSYLHTKFHDNWISSFRGVAMTRFWDGQTDGVTGLLDLLSPLATQVKTRTVQFPAGINK